MDIIELQKERERLISELQNNKTYIRLQAIEQYLSTFDSGSVQSVSNSSNSHSGLENSDNNYPMNASYKKQLVYVIRKLGRFVHSNEILQAVSPFWKDKSEREKKTRISVQLSSMKRKGIADITNIAIDGNNKKVVWGFKTWLEDDLIGDEPKKEFMYNTEQFKTEEW